ncbi:MAG: ketoacyl-ACP synthase III [Chitinispirillia bacterium]|nr:ketoacyl-ACP synthase III [Chitinispirillia bacterium]
MAFFKVENVKVSGISACVPKQIEDNAQFPLFDDKDLQNFVATTGVERKHRAPQGVITSDLCVAAAEALISDLHWNREDISILVFVTQTADYILPATSPIIQHKLGLGKGCYTLDISLGCSGWVYGMSVVSSLMTNFSAVNGSCKALLLAGEVTSLQASADDKSTYPLFGDAGTATALEYQPGAEPLLFGMNSDGEGYEAIIINDGGYRNPFSVDSLKKIERGDGIVSTNLHTVLDGMNVFAFGIREAPRSVNGLIEAFGLDKDTIDYFTFHQANMLMNEKIRTKLKLPPEKVPYSLKNFGNTSSASIPLTLVTELCDSLREKKSRHIACGFGVGLSWGSMYFMADNIACPALVEV